MGVEGRDVWEEAGGSVAERSWPPYACRSHVLTQRLGALHSPAPTDTFQPSGPCSAEGLGNKEVLSGWEPSSPAWIWQRFHSAAAEESRSLVERASCTMGRL